MPDKIDINEIIRKHGAKLESQIKSFNNKKTSYSREYMTFKQEMAPELSRYEKWCKTLGSILKLKVSKKDEIKIQKSINIAHLELEPWQSLTLSVMAFASVFILGLLISVSIALIKGSIAEFPMLFFFLMIVLSLFLFYFVNGYPARLANKWRLKASSQMVPAILYIVVYMRHTPNLEKAIAFASEHLQEPLSIDFKKVFYNVEIGKFPTIKESLDNYLETWRDYSSEFIEAFHLIESSLFEADHSRRIASLEKSIQVALDGVYDKMLKFTHGVRSPLTNVYMLGVVLPTLGLALLPLVSAMLGGLVKWYHLFVLFNMIVPFFVFYLTDKILLLRPGGYGESTLLERNPYYPTYKDKKHYIKASFISFPLILIGFLPLIFGHTFIPELLGLQKDYSFSQIGLSFFGNEMIFGFSATGAGPFGIGALILGMFIPLGIALFFSNAFKGRTKKLIVEREKTKNLENEFNNSLFQLGNRLGNGVPPELAFSKVAESSKGLMTENFFRRVNYNIMQMGMGVEKAIFDERRGALIYYPSNLIATSMRVLIESAKKGLKIAAVSLMSISEYVKNIQKITNRLKDMLAEIISDMKSNMTFLAPLLSGIVVGLAAMITSILSKLNIATASTQAGSVAGIGNFGTLLQDIFKIDQIIPPYYLQIAIGIYIIQIIFILTSSLVSINSGEDRLEKTNKTGKNLKTGITLYFIVALFATLALFVLSSIVLGNLI
jgi:Flp pilus assembly protein TadB